MQLLDNRYGRFDISIDDISENPDVILKVMSTVVVTEARFDLPSGSIKYVALSPGFEECEDTNVIPYYDMAYDEEAEEVSWSKQEA